MEEVKVAKAPEQIPASVPAAAVTPVPEVDLITRVSQYKKPEVKPIEVTAYEKEFDLIADPVIKESVLKKYRDLQADYTRKTQDLALQRKELELKNQDYSKWTPERIQNELLNNPQFLQAAQPLLTNPANSGLTSEEFSALTDSEKKQITELSQEVNSLRQSNLQSLVAQKDALLHSRYGDYDTSFINNGIQQLALMNPIDLREHVYKSLRHDIHVQESYEMGKRDALQLNQEKINGLSPENTTTLSSNDVPVKNKNETDINFLVRLGQFRIGQRKKG